MGKRERAMINKELDEALDQYAEAVLKHAKLCKEIDKEWEAQPELEQAWRELEEIREREREATSKWSKLDDQFNDEHAQLKKAAKDAWQAQCNAEDRVLRIIDKLIGINDDER